MSATPEHVKGPLTPQDWRGAVTKYQRPSLAQSVWQIVNTFVPYLLLLFVMYLSLAYSYWLTLALAVVAGGFLVRIFIIFHDCCHGSFFESRKANDILGKICGFLVFTPYHRWRHDHAVHHATSGDLDHRGVGDIYTMTVKEYLAAPRSEQMKYRLFRHPLILLVIGPIYLFLVWNRLTAAKDGPRERRSVRWTNVAVAILLVVMTLTIGLPAYLLIHLPVMFVASSVGVWLFYVQHQFEDAYWASNDEWDFTTAALRGSTYFKLPKVLQWFTGNIGLHHVHHLSARIPNYYLQSCHDETPLFHDVPTITLRSSLRTLSLHLWDEEQRKLISFRQLKTAGQYSKLSA